CFDCTVCPRAPGSAPFPYATLFRSEGVGVAAGALLEAAQRGERLGVIRCRGEPLVGGDGGLGLAALGLEAGEEGEEGGLVRRGRSEEHTLNSSHVKISYAVFCLKKK